MAKVTVEADIDAICDACGARLDTSESRHGNELIVEPCEKCLETAREEARKEAQE